MFKFNNRNTRKLTIKTPERRHGCGCGVFIVNFEHIFTPFSSVAIVNFEQNIKYLQNNKYLPSMSQVRNKNTFNIQCSAFMLKDRHQTLLLILHEFI